MSVDLVIVGFFVLILWIIIIWLDIKEIKKLKEFEC